MSSIPAACFICLSNAVWMLSTQVSAVMYHTHYVLYVKSLFLDFKSIVLHFTQVTTIIVYWPQANMYALGKSN